MDHKRRRQQKRRLKRGCSHFLLNKSVSLQSSANTFLNFHGHEILSEICEACLLQCLSCSELVHMMSEVVVLKWGV
jgi:hypothetical protein